MATNEAVLTGMLLESDLLLFLHDHFYPVVLVESAVQ